MVLREGEVYQQDWIGLSSVLRPRQHSIGYMGDGFLQVKRPNQHYQSTEGTNSTQTNQTHNKQTWTQNTASPLVYNNMGWLGDGSHRRQGCQAWTAVGLPPRYLPPSIPAEGVGCYYSLLLLARWRNKRQAQRGPKYSPVCRTALPSGRPHQVLHPVHLSVRPVPLIFSKYKSGRNF